MRCIAVISGEEARSVHFPGYDTVTRARNAEVVSFLSCAWQLLTKKRTRLRLVEELNVYFPYPTTTPLAG